MVDYQYKCHECGKSYSSEYIEENLIYLCPECGSQRKNEPLHGVLEVDYDFDSLRNKVDIGSFLKQTPGQIWEYQEFFPLKKEVDRLYKPQLNLNNTPVSTIDIENRSVQIFDDTKNPTYSYKDRASVLVALKAKELGITEITTASTGNAGSSLAGICTRLGLTSRIFVPKNIPDGKRIQIQAFGGDLILVDGTYDEAFDVCTELSEKNRWYNRNTAYNPLTIEGKKSAALDIFIANKSHLPDSIIVPVGDGVIISGLFKGFVDLYKLGWIENVPKLYAAQAEGSDRLTVYLESGKYESKNSDTIADSISASAPRNLYMAAVAVKYSGGKGVRVSDEEILKAQIEFSMLSGILPEPSSASVYAAYKKLENDIDENEKVMLMITGSGLKDMNSLMQNFPKPESKTVSQILKEY